MRYDLGYYTVLGTATHLFYRIHLLHVFPTDAVLEPSVWTSSPSGQPAKDKQRSLKFSQQADHHPFKKTYMQEMDSKTGVTFSKTIQRLYLFINPWLYSADQHGFAVDYSIHSMLLYSAVLVTVLFRTAALNRPDRSPRFHHVRGIQRKL